MSDQGELTVAEVAMIQVGLPGHPGLLSYRDHWNSDMPPYDYSNNPPGAIGAAQPDLSITSLDPATAPAGTFDSYIVTVNGTGFLSGDVVNFDSGWDMPTSYVSPTQITFTVGPHASAQPYPVYVHGGTRQSNTVQFTFV